jgi:hypothetical protein
MPTYKINGKTVKTDKPLTDAEIDEIANSLTPQLESTAVGSEGQAIPRIDVNGVAATPPLVEDGNGAAPIRNSFARGLKDPIDAGAQLLPRALSGITSLGGIVPNVFSQFFDKEAARVDAMVKKDEAGYQQGRNPDDTDFGRIAGNIINPANLAVGASVARVLPAAKGIASVAGIGAATGAASGALQPVVEGDFADKKTEQVVGGAVGGAVGGLVMKSAGRVLNPLVTKAEQSMRDLGVKLTPGQMMGGQAKNIEEFAGNLPLVGKYINDAKERALFSFNKGVINKALGKVDEKLPDDVIGRDAVQYVDDIVKKQYDDVLKTSKFKLDYPTYLNVTNAIRGTTLPSPQQKELVKNIMDTVVYSKFPKDGKITGEAYKKIVSDLGQEAQKYSNSATTAEREIGDALQKATQEFKKALSKQNPASSSILRRIDSAYGDITVMRTAAANSGAVNGVFTPNQYKIAVRQRDVTRNKSAFAAGRAKGQNIADNAIEIMGGTAGSTLEGRIATQIGGGVAAMSAPAIVIPAAVLTPALYSETGIKVITALMRNRPEIAKKIGEKLSKNATAGSITAAQVIEEYNRLSKAEE